MQLCADAVEDGKAAAAVAAARQWRGAAAVTAIVCLALLGLQVQPLGSSLHFLAVPSTVGGTSQPCGHASRWVLAGRHEMRAA